MDRKLWIACAGLVAAVAVAHGGAAANGFVEFDDGIYVVDNPHVRAGLSATSVAWAFRIDGRDTYFHPLTWLSLMLDRELFGDDPRGYHVVNLLLHATTVVLLFLALARATARPWPSAIAALLFGIHPLTVEAVAWVTERKSVLSGALGAGAVLAYVRYAEKPSSRRMAAVAGLQVASLLAKPAFIVLPVLLAILDLWPLRRVSGSTRGDRAAAVRRLLVEKAPLVLVSAAMAALVVVSVRSSTAPDAFAPPIAAKAANAIASIARYVSLALWPTRLSVFHPFPRDTATAAVLAGAVVLVVITGLAVATARRRPWVCAGWAWFLVALSPYFGLKQSGLWPAYADRFTYTALVGLAIAVAFGGAELAVTEGHRRALVAVVAAATIGLTVATQVQVRHWKDSIALFTRGAEIEPDSETMQYNLGSHLGRAGRLEEAAAALSRAVALGPAKAADVHGQLATVQKLLGRNSEAEEHYAIALRIDPRDVENLYNFAELLRSAGRMEEARLMYRRFLDLAPADYDAQRRLASYFAAR